MCFHAYAMIISIILAGLYMFYPVEASYQMKCPDGSPVTEKGLHVCCPDYCILCARIVKGFDTSCATNCSGTLSETQPYCKDCQCRQPITEKEKIPHIKKGKCPMGY